MAKKNSAAPLLIGGAALAVVASKNRRKKAKRSSHWGVRVTSDCAIEVVDPDLFQRFLIGSFYELTEADPNLDAFQLTDAMFGEVAWDCPIFPEPPKDRSAVDFYYTLLRSNVRNLVGVRELEPGQIAQNPRFAEFSEWYRHWRNPPSPEIPSYPKNQAAFSSDMSHYEIGPDWYGGTIKPFVHRQIQEGRGDMAFEDAIQHLSVAVGLMIVPIANLPAEAPSVGSFVAKLDEAVNQAKMEA